MQTAVSRLAALVTALATAHASVAADSGKSFEDSLAGSPSKLIRDLLDQRVAADENDIVKYAELIEGSTQVVQWSTWQDYRTRNALLDAAVKHPRWNSSYAASDYAQALADDAKADLLPQFTGGADYSQRYSSDNPLTSAAESHYGAVTTQLNVTQLVYDGSGTRNAWNAAIQSANAQEYRSELEQSDVLLNLLEAKLNSQRLDIQKYWLTKLESQRKKSTEKVMQRFELGASTIYDIARSELKQYDLQISFGQIEQERAAANAVLLEYKIPDNAVVPIIASKVNQDELLLSQIESKHPLIEEARYLVSAAQLELSAARAFQNAPKVNLKASVSRRDYDAYKKPAYDASLVLKLTHNLYAGGRDSAQIAQSAAKLQQVLDELELRKRSLRSNILQSGAESNQLLAMLEKRKAAVRSSLVVYASTARIQDLKRGDLAELQRVEDELNGSMRALIDNWFDLGVSYLRYLHLTGNLKRLFFEAYQQQ